MTSPQLALDKCPDCGQYIIRHQGTAYDIEPGDLLQGRVTIYARHMLAVDREGVEYVIELTGPRLRAARENGVRLFRRHGITCPDWWKGRVRT